MKLMDYRLKGITSPSDMGVEIPGSNYNSKQDFSVAMQKSTSRVMMTSRQTSSRGSLQQINPNIKKKRNKIEQQKTKEVKKNSKIDSQQIDPKEIFQKRLKLLNFGEDEGEKLDNIREKKKKEAKATIKVSESCAQSEIKNSQTETKLDEIKHSSDIKNQILSIDSKINESLLKSNP